MKNKLKETLSNIMAYLFKCERRTLLWENPNPSAFFSAQSIYMNLSEYDAFDVIVCDYAGDATRRLRWASMRCFKGGTFCVPILYWGGSRLDNFSMRPFTFYDNRVDIAGGYNYSEANNGNAVPVKIYGIKVGGGGVLLNSILKAFSHLQTGGGVV